MREILRDTYLKIAGTLCYPKPGIHIINAHYVTKNLHNEKDVEIFTRFLNILSFSAELICLEEATELILQKKIPQNKTLIALTFDDGFEECYTVIAPLLECYKTRGAFFINSNYIDSTKDYRLGFNKRTATHTKNPMTWQQITDLHRKGHLICSHNLDHTNLAKLDGNELVFQIKENKRILENKLDYSCDYFAWTYGQTQDFSESALSITSELHKYIFSGTNYKNYFSFGGKAINRRHIEPFWDQSHINYFLSVNKLYNK